MNMPRVWAAAVYDPKPSTTPATPPESSLAGLSVRLSYYPDGPTEQSRLRRKPSEQVLRLFPAAAKPASPLGGNNENRR